MKNDCLFCAIIDGEIPSYLLYEDELFYVMLDRFPKHLGHVLILPKRHAAHIFTLNEEEARGLFPLAQRIAAAMRGVLEYSGLNLLQNNGAAAGQEVNHFHLHLIPRFDGDDMAILYTRQDPSEGDFEEVLKKLKDALIDLKGEPYSNAESLGALQEAKELINDPNAKTFMTMEALIADLENDEND